MSRLPLYVFLVAYFLTTVFANILYATPLGHDWPKMSISDFRWESLSGTFGLEFWLLILSPFAVVPIAALLPRSILRPAAHLFTDFVPEFSRLAYVVISVALYSYLIFALYQAGAAQLMVSGTDAISAVEARFEVLARLGFWPQMVAQSLLIFLATYAAISASRGGGWFWYAATFWHVTVLTACLILLNMKWPVVLFILTLGLCELVVARRFAVLRSAAVMAIGVALYLVMSVVLLRLVPTSPLNALSPSPAVVLTTAQPSSTAATATSGPAPSESVPPRESVPPATATSGPAPSESLPPRESVPPAVVNADPEYLKEAVAESEGRSLSLLIGAANRMAIAVPFYFSVFSTEHQVCGTISDRIVRKPSACQPSTLIYTRMFGADGFEGRGTAPAAVQITGYALGGWLGAIAALVLTGIAIGCFLVLWPMAQGSNMVAAIFVMGGYAAYFWSQLPFEGALVYSHGVLWWAALVVVYATLARAYRRRVSTRKVTVG